MDAGGEIDLTGLKEQIEGTQKSIENLNKALGKTGNTLTSIEHKEVGQRLHDLSSSVNDLFSAIANTKGIENSVGAMKSLTEAMEVLNKAMTATKNASTLFKTGYVEGEIGAASNSVKDLMERLADGITKIQSKSQQVVKVVMTEFDRLKSFKMPPALSDNEMEKIVNMTNAKQQLADAKKKVEELQATYENLRNTMQNSSKTGGVLPRLVGEANKELNIAKDNVITLENHIKEGESAWLKYREAIRDIVPSYAQILEYSTALENSISEMKDAQADPKIIKSLERQKSTLDKMIAPYDKMIEFELTHRENIEKTIGISKTEAKIASDRTKKEQEYLGLKEKLAAASNNELTPLQRAEEFNRRRLEIMSKLISLQESSKGVKDVGVLQAMTENAKKLETELFTVTEQLNALLRGRANYEKVKFGRTDGGSAVGDALNSENESENIKSLLNNYARLRKLVSDVLTEQGQKYEQISKRVEKYKKNVNSLGDVLKRIQREKVSQGDESAIASYLKQELSIKRLKQSLDGIRNAQERCNHATLEGRQQYEKLEFEARKLQKTLDQIQGKQSILNKMFVKMKLGVGQISTAFGVMGGVFGAVNFIKSLYKITSEFQLQQKALAAIIQNAREANVLFKQMQSLAVESPLKLMDLNKYAKQLAAFRIETNKIYDSLKMLGDISVGVGVDMDRLILAYGQVKAANYLRGQELRQFSEAGVNILGGLQKYYEETKNITMTINEIFDSVSKRKVLFEDVDAVLHRMTESGGTFFNMQLVQSQTLYGQYQKLGDMFQIEMNKIGSSTSGILLSAIKILQFFIQNLRIGIDALMAFGAYKGMTKLVASFQTGTLVSKEFIDALKLANVQLKNLVTLNFSKFIANMRSASAAAQMLKRSLYGIGAAAAVFAITEIVSYYQRQKQAAKELSDELVELNRRYSDIQENEKLFKEKTAYKERIAVLQQLVDKAKEYNIQLEIAKNVNASNLEQVYNDALNQLKDFVGQINYYKTVFSTDKTFKKDTKDAAEEYASLNTQWSLAQEAAKEAYKSFLVNSEYIPQEMKEFWEETIKMQEDYKDKSYEKEQENLQKYGYTSDAWEKEFARRINIISDYYKKTETLHAKGSGYGGSADPDALFSTTRISYTFPDVNGKNNPLNQSSKNIDEYVRKEKKAFDELAKAIKTDLEENGENLTKWSKMTEDELVKNIPTTIKAWEDVFKSYGITEEDVIKRLFAAVTETKPKIVFRAMLLYNNKETDLFTSEFNKDLENLLGNNGELEFDVKFNTQVYVDENEVKKQVATEDQIKEAHDRVKNALKDKNIVSGEAQEAWRKEKKAIEDEIKEYKKVEASTGSVIEKTMLMIRVNRKLGESFYSPTDALAVLNAELEQVIGIGERYQFEEKKKTHARTQSMKSEYQSMIDFVRELNKEFDTLRKNFNEKDSAKWAGATNRILSSFEAKFGAMPAKFRKAFQDSLASIDFTTKEGTVNAENIVKGLIDSAKDLTKKEKSELQRAWGEAVGQIKLEAELELKAREDERLKAQVQKMFDDYNLTIELDKLGVDADEVGKLFNIDTKDLLTLERKLESMKEEFVGRNMEKEYRQFMRKIVEINDKANLEMAKKYVKYLREEYNERAKIELEYMKQRAEVYALPFDENETMRILENLQKETKKKLDEIDWKTFTGSDMYIEVFEDLERVSNSAIESMLKHLEELKDSLKDLSPTELKTLVGQMQKLRDEMLRRDPFKALTDSIRALRDESKKGSETSKLINKVLGVDEDAPIKNFRKALDEALRIAREKQLEAQKEVDLKSTLLGAGKERESASKWLKENGIDWSEYYDTEDLDNVLAEIEQKRNEAAKAISNDRLQEILGEEDKERLGLSDNEREYLKFDQQAKYISQLISAYKELDKKGLKFTSIEDLSSDLDKANDNLKEVTEQSDKLAEAKAKLDVWAKAIKAAGEVLAAWTQKAKESFDAVFEGLESLGVGTDAISQAWKQFGDDMFDTITRALTAIPAMTAAIVGAETAIQAASGWIGLIAEAITLIMAGIKAVAGLHDSLKQAEIDKLQKTLDKLSKTANDLDEAFDSLFDEDKLRQFDAALVNTRDLAIDMLEEMKRVEGEKKKPDQTLIDDYEEQIENFRKEQQEGINKFYESLGGFGSEANMKSMAESWTDAWYDAFKETGDGLSGLEDSFDEFIDNLYKKTILNKLSEKYFKDLYTQLDNILATEGGLTNNLDAFNDWIGLVQNAFDGFNEDATAAMNALSNVYGAGGGLEGLQASIQGMTEETADILAAYLNSVRFYVADNNQLLQNLYNVMAIDNEANPMLQQLKIIAAQTTAIHNVFDSVVSFGGDVSGNFVKVKISQ